MNKVYSRINWENEPSTKTPLNEHNLNKIDFAVDEIDNRVIELDSTKAKNTDLQTLSTRVDNLILNAGDSSAECADARVTEDGTVYDTLKNRLDAEHSSVIEDISQLSDDIENFYNITDIPPIINDFYQKFVNRNGVLVATTDSWYNSGRNSLNGVVKIKINTIMNGAVSNIAFYTKDSDFLSYANCPDDTQNSLLTIEKKDIPSNADYFIATFKTDIEGYYCKTYTINNETSEIIDARTDYKGITHENVGSHIREVTQQLSDKNNELYNIIDILPILKSGYQKFVNRTGSIVNNTANWYISDRISLNDVVKIEINTVMNGIISNIAFYDYNNTFISYANCPDSTQNSLLTIEKKDIPSNADYFIATFKTDIEGYYCKITTRYSEIYGKNIFLFGDSITSGEVSQTGNYIARLLHANYINFAHGNATCSDWYDETTKENISVESPIVSYESNGSASYENRNVLSNQIRRALCYCTNEKEVKYTHPIDGEFTLNSEIWNGNGTAENKPDIIYIAIGINDGSNDTIFSDDSNVILNQSYSELNRVGMASSLRWAIETLQSAFPNANIFVCSPLNVGSNITGRFQYYTTNQKGNVIKTISDYCSTHFIDSLKDSGFSRLVASSVGSDDGLHPNVLWAKNNAKFIYNEICNRYVQRIKE